MRQSKSSLEQTSRLVFTNEVGEHLVYVPIYKRFKEIAPELGYDQVRFHDLRHPYVKCRTQYLETQ